MKDQTQIFFCEWTIVDSQNKVVVKKSQQPQAVIISVGTKKPPEKPFGISM
ncbi:MAG: hypothetical protein WDK96_02275 [Candidatus Paceibacterota bacterium]|jgi:hypothetical protein